MVTGIDWETGVVVIVKLADVAPCGTVTDDGTVAAFVALLASATTNPPAGAAPVRPTCPSGFLPPGVVATVLTADNVTAGSCATPVVGTRVQLTQNANSR
jgi:hypothetical protein